jgi:hypothetical protein
MELSGLSSRCQPGLQFGARYVCDPAEGQVFDYLPESMLPKVKNLATFAGMLVADKWLGNANGRQAVFWKKTAERKYTATLCCDFSYVMTEPSVRAGRGFQST